MDVKFFDSLYEGDSPNGVKLGMGLTGGDFWPRPAGCQNLYRGISMEAIDFANILTVAGPSETQIASPNWLEHLPLTTYFYLVRRANSCGQEEHTLGAAEKVVIDSFGNLAEPRCNSVFSVRVRQIDANKIELVWFYLPIDQEASPYCFRVYGDNGSGQIDYDNPVTQIDYVGRKFYTWRSETLSANKYLFCIRAQTETGVDDGFLGQIKVHLETSKPGAIEILEAEVL
jgi:hypothetical protein